MKLLCVGGGSGGHVTPVLAVINEVAKLDPKLSVVFVTDKAFLKQTEGLIAQSPVPIEVRTVSAGKFRRYMDMALWKQVLRPDIGGKNMVDMFKVAGGVAQSIRMLKKFRPDVVFAKGGYVSLPVGYAAHLLKVPLVIHDSDARPGLTNRVLSRWATAIATGTPIKNYRYNAEIAHYTGVPVKDEFHPYSAEEKAAAKKEHGHTLAAPLVVVTGGGLGAKDINQAMVKIAQKLIDTGYEVTHVTGKANFDELSKVLPEDVRYHIQPFVYNGLASLYGAADVVVTRASATTLQELAAAAKPAIIVPNSSLGDQIENAKTYAADGAARMLRDEELAENPDCLFEAIKTVLADSKVSQELTTHIARYAKPNAAAEVAALIVRARK